MLPSKWQAPLSRRPGFRCRLLGRDDCSDSSAPKNGARRDLLPFQHRHTSPPALGSWRHRETRYSVGASQQDRAACDSQPHVQSVRQLSGRNRLLVLRLMQSLQNNLSCLNYLSEQSSGTILNPSYQRTARIWSARVNPSIGCRSRRSQDATKRLLGAVAFVARESFYPRWHRLVRAFSHAPVSTGRLLVA